MSRAFGTTPHSEIMRAFEAEGRKHTFVEQLEGGGYTKKYELRVSPEKLLTLLDALAPDVKVQRIHPGFSVLAARQLRAEILATLGLYEEG